MRRYSGIKTIAHELRNGSAASVWTTFDVHAEHGSPYGYLDC